MIFTDCKEIRKQLIHLETICKCIIQVVIQVFFKSTGNEVLLYAMKIS